MAEANGTPIRLVKDNKELIELEATSIALTVERDVDVTPLAATGGRRYAIDLNRNRSIIVIEGVFTDDRKTSDATAATALIDFSSYYDSRLSRNNWTITRHIDALLQSPSNRLKLKSTDGTTYSLAFSTGASVGYDSGTPNTVVVKTTGGTYITAAQFATAVTSWINTDATAKFTASTITSEQSGQTGTAVSIAQKTAGRLGNQNAYPLWSVRSYSYVWRAPYTERFSGGVDGTKKSAGDKVADIYGIMNNSTRQFGTDVDSIGDAAGQVLGAIAAAILTGGLSFISDITEDAAGDYISGIQIPYNSTISAGGDTYVARNFFMSTGNTKSAFAKSSNANTLPAGVTFDTGDEYTGIQGILKKIDITHDAGESVYGFNMVFLPADWVA
jgi:hypothetical protein